MPLFSVALRTTYRGTASRRAAFDRTGRRGVAAPLGHLRARLAGLVAAALLMAALLGVAVAQTAPIRGELSVTTNEGYARLVFHFADDVESEVRMANGLVIIGFRQPVSVNVERLPSMSNGWVGAARRDPDGRGIRIALSRSAKLNTLTAGERLYVDLLPDNWKGAPPGLPQQVVEELARRAREAEREIKRQQQLVRQKQMPLTRVRVSHQPTFSRYVFDLPDLIPVATSREKDALVLTFDAALKFDLADAKGNMPPMVGGVDTEILEQATTVRFGFIGNVDVRTFREDESFVVDVGVVDAQKRRGAGDVAGRAAELAAILADSRDRRRG
ncbi:tetratricopeptide repeat protein, partial [Rhodoplanes sp. SY1]